MSAPPQSRAKDTPVDWYTPPSIFQALGLHFDLDPCAPEHPAADWLPVSRRISLPDDGLAEPWSSWRRPDGEVCLCSCHSSAAHAAGKTSLATTLTSPGVQVGNATSSPHGAATVSASTPGSSKLPAARTPPREPASSPRSAAMPPLPAGEPPSADSHPATTPSGEPGSPTSPTAGPTPTGSQPSPRSTDAAPTAEAQPTSPSSTLFHSPTPAAPAPFPATSSPPADPATTASETRPSSDGGQMLPPACSQCATCSPLPDRVYLNPPYGDQCGRWVGKLAEHGRGIALVFARTDASWFQAALGRATSVTFLAQRVSFIPGHRSDRSCKSPNAAAPSCLIAFGGTESQACADSGLGITLDCRDVLSKPPQGAML